MDLQKEEQKNNLIKINKNHELKFDNFNLCDSGLMIQINKGTMKDSNDIVNIHEIPADMLEEGYTDFMLAYQLYQRRNIFNKFLKECNG